MSGLPRGWRVVTVAASLERLSIGDNFVVCSVECAFSLQSEKMRDRRKAGCDHVDAGVELDKAKSELAREDVYRCRWCAARGVVISNVGNKAMNFRHRSEWDA